MSSKYWPNRPYCLNSLLFQYQLIEIRQYGKITLSVLVCPGNSFACTFNTWGSCESTLISVVNRCPTDQIELALGGQYGTSYPKSCQFPWEKSAGRFARRIGQHRERAGNWAKFCKMVFICKKCIFSSFFNNFNVA